MTQLREVNYRWSIELGDWKAQFEHFAERDLSNYWSDSTRGASLQRPPDFSTWIMPLMTRRLSIRSLPRTGWQGAARSSRIARRLARNDLQAAWNRNHSWPDRATTIARFSILQCSDQLRRREDGVGVFCGFEQISRLHDPRGGQ
jgi:hypothetical protein